MAETVWNTKYGGWLKAESFGLSASNGATTATNALLALQERGYRGVKTPATPVKSVDLSLFTHVVCMEEWQKNALSSLYGNTLCVLSAKDVIGQEILDVIGKDVPCYMDALTTIERLAESLFILLNREDVL